MPPVTRRSHQLFDDECIDDNVEEDNAHESGDEEDYDDDDEYEQDSFLVPSDDDDENYTGSGSSDDEPLQTSTHKQISTLTVNSTPSQECTSQKTPRRRGRPRKNHNTITPTNTNVSSPDDPSAGKQPGHFTFPQNDFSLTISKPKGDVDLSLLDSIHTFFQTFCIKGAVSTEVGHRAHNLHFQGLFRTRFPKDKLHLTALAKIFKDMIKPRTGYKILVKPFSPAQTIQAMIGYITKDDGKY